MSYSSACQMSGIAGDILIIGFERHGKDHDEMLMKVL